jgi:hypothetical protein
MLSTTLHHALIDFFVSAIISDRKRRNRAKRKTNNAPAEDHR